MSIEFGKLIKRSVIFVLFIISLMIACYVYKYNKTYDSIKISTVKSAVVEYGSPNYDISKLVKKVDGKIVSVKKDIDTTKIGKQKIIVSVEKDNVVKEVPISIEVKDTVAPEIKIKEKNIVIDEGTEFNFLDNLISVYDTVDGNLNYQMKEIVNEGVDTNYYTVLGDIDTNTAGSYTLTIRAVDKYNNTSTLDFVVTVKEKVSIPNTGINDNYVSSANTKGLVEVAYSLVGKPYVSGANGPYGFDCSGFVQYVYSRVGISISRSSTTQIHDGVGISYSNMQPGDILSWGYNNGYPTHSALYVGNGQMIHATNPRQGVIVSDVAAWARGSGTNVIAVRRI